MAPFLHPCLNLHNFAQIFSSETQIETKLYYLCVHFEYRKQIDHALLYKIKGQHMNMSTLCPIKYMNRSYFSNARYMIGVGFKILGRTPVPKLPPSYHPEIELMKRRVIHTFVYLYGPHLPVLTYLGSDPKGDGNL